MKLCKLHKFIFGFIAVFLLAPNFAYSRAIIADLNPRKIEIKHDFLGTQILVYGARNDAGSIAVIVRGPEKTFLVRQKQKVAGIWMNVDSVEFKNTPSFYSASLMSSLSKIRNDNLLKNLKIGIKNQDLQNNLAENSAIKIDDFEQALISYLERKKLFNPEPYQIAFWGETLFRTSIDFPRNILPGVYNIDVYLFNDGLLSSVQSTPLIVDKVGFEAFVFNFAHTNKASYAALCVLMAFLIGFMARFLFARD
jgi:uncharacterized protein (TIGR02186 family)